MKKIYNGTNESLQKNVSANESETDGYPLYPENEDIYYKFKKEKTLDPEDITKTKEIKDFGKFNEKDFNFDVSVNDLDIPGTELDEMQEFVGIEDEENNYFSLGGDDHIDLEENLGY